MRKILSLLIVFSLLFSPIAWARDLYQAQKPPLGSTIDWSHPLSKGLVGCWLFQPNGFNPIFPKNLVSGVTYITSGNDALPESLNPGVDNNGSYIHPDFNNCFNSSNDRLVNSMDIKNYTAIVAFKQMSTTISGGHLVVNSAALRFNGNKWAFFKVGVGGNFDGTTTINPYQYYVGGFTLGSNGKLARLYLNGKIDNTNTNYGTTFSPGGNVTIAALNTGNNDANTTRYYYVYIYNRALSPQEIQQLYIDPYCFIKQPSYRLYAPTEVPPVTVEFNTQIFIL